MPGEGVASLGLGSIGATSLRLLLSVMDHPASIRLCDVYDRRTHLGQLAGEISGQLGFRGEVDVLCGKGAVHDGIYGASLIVGATSVPNVLDVSRLRPGTLIADDSGPHCFDSDDAMDRVRRSGDLVFSRAAQLHIPDQLRTI